MPHFYDFFDQLSDYTNGRIGSDKKLHLVGSVLRTKINSKNSIQYDESILYIYKNKSTYKLMKNDKLWI